MIFRRKEEPVIDLPPIRLCLNFNFPFVAHRKLMEKAKKSGLSVNDYVSRVLERAIDLPD